MERFICDYLSPTFKKENIKTEIWAGTYRVVDRFDALELFNHAKLRQSVKGVGVQYTAPSYLTDFRTRYPDVRMMHTECICYNGKNTVEQATSRLGEIASYINAGSENFAYWNMILDETTKSGWGWAQNSLLNINRQTGDVTYNPDYAVMSLISHFLRPGDIRIASVISNKQVSIAVKSPDGTCKVIMQNSTEKIQTASIQIAGKQVQQVTVPAKALIAIIMRN
jgi:glucosylceramidase